MTVPALPFDRAATPPGRRLALLGGWAVAAGFLIARHVVWRDEVRALTLALEGADLPAMLRSIRGEGHPAAWYVILRVAHDAIGSPLVLQGAAAVVGLAGAALLALRAPFRWWVIALALAGHFLLFEYTVSARNYGISMLCLFAVAALPRERWLLLGVLLALLCNTNVGAVIPAGAIWLFRAVELGTGRADRAAWRGLALAGAIAAAGVIACFLTVWPPVNDAAVASHPEGAGAAMLAGATGWARGLHSLAPAWLAGAGPGAGRASAALLTLLLVAGPAGLARTPGGLAAGAAGLVGLSAFHNLLYPGSERHHALYLVLLLALHWMAAAGGGGRWRTPPAPRIIAAGQWLTLALFALQLPASGMALARAARGEVFSHSRSLAALLATPALRDAVVIAQPDHLVEPLAYYRLANPIWIVRERRWGRTVRYTRDLRRDLSLDDLLAEARWLRARTGRRVVIAIGEPLDPAAPRRVIPDGYVTTFASDPRQVRAFQAAARRIARFTGSQSREDYDVYLLDRADSR